MKELQSDGRGSYLLEGRAVAPIILNDTCFPNYLEHTEGSMPGEIAINSLLEQCCRGYRGMMPNSYFLAKEKSEKQDGKVRTPVLWFFLSMNFFS